MEKRGKEKAMPAAVISATDIGAAAARAGFSQWGVAPCRPMPENLSRLGRWIGSGKHGGLSYMERNGEKRADPQKLFPGTASVIVCAVNYRNTAWNIEADGRPLVASYAFARDYHVSIKSMLSRILGVLQEKYPGLKGRMLTDTAPIFEKAWAVEAGLGWIGKNSLLVTPQFGSSVLLGELIVNLPVDKYDRPYTRIGCGSCTACIDACPNRAIGLDKTIDTRKCISCLTVEPGATDPGNLCGRWVFGCDACQVCCPHNAGKPYTDSPMMAPVIDPATIDKRFWGKINFEEFTRLFAGTPLERAGLEKVWEKAKGMVTNGR